MSFKEWAFSSYPNPSINGQWGVLHIIVLLACIATIILLTLFFRRSNEKTHRIILWILVGLIFIFEISRRIINFAKMENFTWNGFLYNLFPRPWCAISCWMLIISAIVNKKFFYNIASITSLLCAVIFFAYPGVGFNNQYILFENLYSIATHSLLLVASITLITLKFTSFKYESIWKELICLAAIYLYAFFEMFVLNIEQDPLYFMPNNDIHDILGLNYPGFLFAYIVFVFIWVNSFYFISNYKRIFSKLKKHK